MKNKTFPQIIFLSVCLSTISKHTSAIAKSRPNGNPHQGKNLDFFETRTLPRCPQEFVEVENFCFTVSEKSSFPSKCPFEDVLPFDTYRDIILERNLGPVWMPVRRNVSGFYQYTEFSSLYKRVFNESFQAFSDTVKKNCLLFYNNTFIVAVSCEDQHSRICAYNKLEQSLNQLCSKDFCFECDYNTKNKCYCLGNLTDFKQNQHKAEFIKIYQNVVYEMLTNDTCTIGLEKTPNGTFIWSTSKKKIDYAYWSEDVDFDSGFKYGAATPKGWVLTQSPLSCTLLEKDVEEVVPSLQLMLDDANKTFYLNASGIQNLKKSGEEFLIFCFTDAHPLELLYRYFPLNVTYRNQGVIIFRFEPLEYGPGVYWCESSKYSDSTIIKSNSIFFREQKSLEFVAKFPLASEGIFFNQEFVDSFQTFLLGIDHVKNNYIPRIMKIQQSDENNQTLLNVHFSLKCANVSYSEETQYELLRVSIQDYLEASTNPQVYYLVDFLSADFCLSVSDNLTWPKTEIGLTAFSEEFCFLPNGNRQSRLCGGTFVDGARWLPINIDCNIQNTSSASEQLLSLLTNTSLAVVVTEICYISASYEKLNSFDIYLIYQLFENVQTYQFFNNQSVVEEVFQIIDNLLYVDSSILRESQKKMKATDCLLTFIENLLTYKNSPDVTIKGTKFVFVSSRLLTNLTGMIVENDGNQGFITSVLTKNITTEYMLATAQTECAILISPELYHKLNDDNKISIMIYYNDGFFGKALTKVFSLQFSNAIEDFGGPVRVLYRVASNDSLQFFCAFWNNGSWNEDSEPEEDENFQICEFRRTGNFALIGVPANKSTSDNETNVTSDLNDVLNNNYTIEETMQTLSNISERFEEFQSEDVFLLGQILNKVGTSREKTNLDILAQVISNALKIDEKILQKSQSKSKATDIILHNIDEIVNNSKNQTESFLTIKENFIIFAADVKVTNFTGLVVFSDSQSTEIDILEGKVNVDDIISSKIFHGAVILSSQLKAQMIDESKIVITIFLKKSFFNDTSNSSSVDLIFGVILPEIGRYSGPVSVYHKNYGRIHKAQCVHWCYNPLKNITGFWKEDSQGGYNFSSIRCDFWHTTHLGLLLLREDKYEDIFKLMWWINLVDGSLSVLGFCGIILTAILFEKWRCNTGNQILLNFVLAIMIQLSTFYVFGDVGKQSKDYKLCVAMGAVLHYAILAQFSWMFVIGILQFKRFVIVLGNTPKYLLLKACLFGWGWPLLFVSGVLLFDQESYLNAKINFCYPSGLGLTLGVWLPIAITVAFNLCIFIYILYNVCYTKNVTSSQILHQWRLAIHLYFLLGITWIFGLLSNLRSGIVFLYLFNFTANLQGFVIFLYFILFNKNTRNLYLNAFRRCCRRGY